MENRQNNPAETVMRARVSVADVAKYIAAFLNTSGGRLLLGVDTGGKVVGVSMTPDELYFGVRSLISPEPRFAITLRHIGDKTIALIDVPVGTERPYVFKDVILVSRDGATDNASPQEISEMILVRGSEAPRWERQTRAGIDISDLDHRQISATKEAYSQRGSHQSWLGQDMFGFMNELGLSNGGQLFNSAVVLFARPEVALSQSAVRIAAFESSDRSSFKENRVLQGNLFDLFDQITLFLDRHLGVSTTFEHTTRHDRPAIPPFVVREAVMNALVHRDYSAADANVMIALHPDKFEIWNPGNLPEGLDPENLPQAHVSRPVNPDIANVAFLRGLVERWGSGTGRIVAECRKIGLNDPVWELIGGGVRLTISLKTLKRNEDQVLNKRIVNFLKDTRAGEIISFDEYRLRWGVGASQKAVRNDIDVLLELGALVEHDFQPPSYMRIDSTVV